MKEITIPKEKVCFDLKNPWAYLKQNCFNIFSGLASVGILGKERQAGVGNLGWDEDFDTGFQNLVCGPFNTVEI